MSLSVTDQSRDADLARSSAWTRRVPTFLLASTMFFTGGCGLVIEYVLSTVSSYILGNSIEQFSLIIALMMLFMGLGAVAQRFISDARLVEKFIGVEIMLALAGGFAPIGIYAAFTVMEDHFKLVLYGLAAFIGFLIGIEIPFVMRINQGYARSLGVNIADTFAWDYIGSFVGALIWTYWLLRTFPLTEISFLVAGVNFLVATATFAYFIAARRVERPWALLTAIGLTAAALSYGYSQNRRWTVQLDQRIYDDPIIFSRTTRYQHLVMTHDRSLGEAGYRFYINGNLQFFSADEAIYHEHLVHPAMALSSRPHRVLILGGGDGLALREVLKYPKVKEIALVDIDPEMIEVCSTHPVLTKMNQDAFADARVRADASVGICPTEDDRGVFQETGRMVMKRDRPRPETMEVARVTVYTVDADLFVAQPGGGWDVILIDLPDPNSVELAKLYSRQFYMKCRRQLRDDGIMVVQSTSPYHSKEAFLCVRRTLEAARFHTLPYHDNVPSFGDWGFLMAWKDTRPPDAYAAKIEAFRSIPVATRYLTPEVFRRATTFGKGWLESDRREVSTLMRPVILDYYLRESWKIE